MENVTIMGAPDLERLRPYEMAARIYCRKADLDPDHQMRQPHPSIEGVMLAVPFWAVVAEKMIDLSTMLTSIREASSAANDVPA